MTYNAIECKKCGDIVTSRHRHDFNVCNCSNGSFIDGGFDYIRMGGVDMSLVQLGEYNTETKKFTPSEVKREN